MRLAFVSGWRQMRHGAGKSTAASASSASRMITDALLTARVSRRYSISGRKESRSFRGRRLLPEMRTRRAFLLKQSLLHFFLAAKAVAGPRHRFQALLLKLFVAGDAFAERAVFDPRKG